MQKCLNKRRTVRVLAVCSKEKLPNAAEEVRKEARVPSNLVYCMNCGYYDGVECEHVKALRMPGDFCSRGIEVCSQGSEDAPEGRDLMRSVVVRLVGTQDLKDFVSTAVRIPDKIEAGSNKYKVDGKSFIGMLSLDTAKPFRVFTDEKYLGEFKKWAI